MWSDSPCETLVRTAYRNGEERRSRINERTLAERVERLTGVKREKGQVCMHLCDEPRCDNVEHIVISTQSANILDAYSKGRMVLSSQRGEQNGNAKMTEAEVIAIRWMKATSGLRISEIARQFGLDWGQVKRIVTYEHWGWVRCPI